MDRPQYIGNNVMATVMIVDDSSVMRKAVSNIITKHTGHTVVGEAVNGEDAVKKYEVLKPDIVTMDITMPVMDGITAVYHIIKKYPDANIIMLSSEGQRKNVLSAIRNGAKNFLLKPLRPSKIRDAIDHIVDNTFFA